MRIRLWVIFSLLCCSLLGCQAGDFDYNSIRVKKALDGDTVILANGEKVRLIGIDTPEVRENKRLYWQAQRAKTDIQSIMRMGRRSSEFMRSLVEGKFVRLEFDAERRDKYNRLLAYVYLADGTLVNAKIVEAGYASLLSIPPNVRHAARFRELYQQARANKLGLWKDR